MSKKPEGIKGGMQSMSRFIGYRVRAIVLNVGQLPYSMTPVNSLNLMTMISTIATNIYISCQRN